MRVKASTRSLIIGAMLLLVAMAVAFSVLPRPGESPLYFWVAIIGFAAFAVYGIHLWVDLYVRICEERSLRAAIAGKPPADAAWTAVCGEWKTLEPLVAPISREEAVFYEYEIYTIDSSGEGVPSDRIHYEGRAIAPSFLISPTGLHRIFVLPEIRLEPAPLERATAVWNATIHVSTRSFSSAGGEDLRKSFMNDEPTDDRGGYRADRLRPGENPPVEKCELREWRVPNGHPACVFGFYSDARGGFVVKPGSMRRSRLILKDAEGALAELRFGKASLVVFASLMMLFAAGILVLYDWWAVP